MTDWTAMLTAGVFGTVLGDVSSHRFGQSPAAIGLVVLLATARSRAATSVAVYWCAVGLPRTAGTCIGDWFAEKWTLHVGLPLSTLLTGTASAAILPWWRSAKQGEGKQFFFGRKNHKVFVPYTNWR